MALALVTGGTAGIGHAFAVELASRGWDLVLVARDTARLEAVAEDLRTRFGRETETITADLAVRADMLRVAERLECTEHPIDMLINNAGFGIHASLLDKDFSIQEKALGRGHADFIGTLADLAELYYSEGRVTEAEPLYKMSLAAFEQALGEEHPRVADRLEDYASVLRGLYRSDDAAILEARARAIRTKHSTAL